jgi:hypothetical protein
MNTLCECQGPGFCNRHQMDKNDTAFSLCNGTAPCADCGLKYWMAWEFGKLGATQPDNPVPNPPAFCDPSRSVNGPVPCSGCTSAAPVRMTLSKYVTNATQALTRFIGDGMKLADEETKLARLLACETCPLNRAGWCGGCGCNLALKTASRIEECPGHKWFPAVRKTRKLDSPKTNLLMHLLPVAANNNWKWNLKELKKRDHLFNSKKVLAIAIDERSNVGGRNLKTVSADEVIAYSRCIGLEWDVVEAFPNDQHLREVATFEWLMSNVVSIDPNEITFFCQGKAVTHSDDSITVKWGQVMYDSCLDDFSSVVKALETFSIAGSLRRFGEFTTPNNNRWHYSGTFFWFRNDDVFKTQKWKTIDREFFGVESWPGLMFKPEESACLFGDNVGSLYEPSAWVQLEEKSRVWKECRET